MVDAPMFHPQAGDGPAIVAARLRALEIGPPTNVGPLTVFPLLGDSPLHPPYSTLQHALADTNARVEEVSADGSVPELLVLNEGPAPLLLIDGEELVGGKQNRIVNASCLVPARSKLRVPVSCVEAGRWGYLRKDFAASDRVLYARGRARKLRDVTAAMHRDSRAADQGAIWDDIAERSATLGVRSATEAAADVYENHAEALRDAVDHAPVHDHQVGAIFCLRGASGLELFDSGTTFRAVFPKLVRSWALEALTVAPYSRTPDRRTAGRLLVAATRAAAEASQFDSLGLGRDLRFDSARLAGAALLHEGQLIHLAAYQGLAN